MNALFFSFVVFSILSLRIEAGILDHLKPVDKSHQQQSLPGIDCTYLINLDFRPERLERSLKLLAPYGVIPRRFSAVCGKDLSLSVINDCGIPYSDKFPENFPLMFYTEEYPYGYRTNQRLLPGQPCFSIETNRGAIGCALSHLSVIKDAYDSGYQRIMVLEDDFEICRDLREIPELIEELESYVGKDWDIFFTDPDFKHNATRQRIPWCPQAYRPDFEPSHPERFFKKTWLNSHIFRTGGRHGAWSMVISRRGMERLLNYFKKHNLFDQIDREYVIPDGVVSLYCSSEEIITHGGYGETDIQGR